MGTDGLFQKRKAKKASDLARRKARRAPYAKVLIVCEGEKTEPHYFKGMKDHYGLNSANVEVCGDCGSDPLSIIRHAKQRYREEKDAGDAFDKVFCVFDQDAHAHYTQGIAAIRGATPQGVYVAITSVPCFEYWLLLHFSYTTKAYRPYLGTASAINCYRSSGAICPRTAKGITPPSRRSSTNWSSPRATRHGH